MGMARLPDTCAGNERKGYILQKYKNIAFRERGFINTRCSCSSIREGLCMSNVRCRQSRQREHQENCECKEAHTAVECGNVRLNNIGDGTVCACAEAQRVTEGPCTLWSRNTTYPPQGACEVTRDTVKPVKGWSVRV